MSFDPRPREGGDSLKAKSHEGKNNVSIHAPAREATSSAA